MIKIMSFNIRYGLAEDGDNHWEKRKTLALARIYAFAPDVLGLQECRDDAQAEFIKANLPDYDFYGVRRGGGPATALEMAPVLVRRDTFQITQTGHFWLSETPHVPGSISWESTFARTVTWARLVHRATGHTLTFANTHFDYHPAAIDGAAHCLHQWLTEVQPTAPVILTGDFNAEKDSAAYHRLTTTLGDAYRQAHPNPGHEATFHAFGQAHAMTAIDWILVSPHFTVLQASVDRSQPEGRFPSDHYPVLAVLGWRDSDGMKG